MSEAEEIDADRSTRADLKKRSTDWTDWACSGSVYDLVENVRLRKLTSMMRARARMALGR